MKLLLSLFALSFLAVSCSSTQTVGQQLTAQGQGPAAALGKEWERADKLVKTGQKQQEEGERMISKGRKLIEKGQETVQTAKRLKAETELAASRAGYLNVGQQ